MTGREDPRTVTTTVAYAEIVRPPDSPVRLALCVDDEVRLWPGDVLHVALSREQGGHLAEQAATALGYRVSAAVVVAGGAQCSGSWSS